MSRAQIAHADAWQAIGRLHPGGAVTQITGARLMASGLPHPAYNNADLTDPAAVDVDELVAWYADRGVPWGVRVPVGTAWTTGTHLFHKPLMELDPAAWRRPAPVPDLTIRAADRGDPADLDRLVAADVAAYGGTADDVRPWLAALLGGLAVTYALAERDGRPVGLGYLLQTDDRAGPAGYLSGIGMVPGAPDGTFTAVADWLLAVAFASGSAFVFVHPDDQGEADTMTTLGFVEVDGLEVYVDLG